MFTISILIYKLHTLSYYCFRMCSIINLIFIINVSLSLIFRGMKLQKIVFYNLLFFENVEH